MNKKSLIFLGLLGLLFGYLVTAEGSFAQEKTEFKTITTLVGQATPEALGSKMGEKLRQAHRLIQKRKFDEANALLDQILSYFKKKIMKDPDVIYVSVADLGEFLTYVSEHSGVEKKTEWIDWVFAEALHRKAFLVSEKKQWKEALRWLEEEIKYAPYSAGAYCEKGYILNINRRFKEALTAYQKALELIKKHSSASNKNFEAVALRGKGFSLIELGDLKGAKEAYQRSLEIDPTSQLALDELKYIKKAEEKKKQRKTGENSIGIARMEEDGTIVLQLRGESPGGAMGEALFRYPAGHPEYKKILQHLGGLKKGQEKPVPPWPQENSGQRSDIILSRSIK